MRCGLCREGDICRVGKLLFASDRAETEYREGNDRMPCTNGGGNGVHTLRVVITIAIINDADISKRRGPTTTVLTRARRSKHNSRTTPRKSHREPEKAASAIAVTEDCENKKPGSSGSTPPHSGSSLGLYLTRIYTTAGKRRHQLPHHGSRPFIFVYPHPCTLAKSETTFFNTPVYTSNVVNKKH